MLKVPVENLKPYKVSSAQLSGAFPNGQMPEELLRQGSAYLVTDKPTMYPDFTNMTMGQQPAGGELTQPEQPAQNNPNAQLAQDILKQGGDHTNGFKKLPSHPPLMTRDRLKRYGGQ